MAERTRQEDGDCLLVAGRLATRIQEASETIYACVRDIGPNIDADLEPNHHNAVHETVDAMVKHTLEHIAGRARPGQPLPAIVTEQARRAARLGVSVGTVIRRYVVGHRVLGELLASEVARSDLLDGATALQRIRHIQEKLLEDVIASIEATYDKELARVHSERSSSHAQIVRKLLGGLPADAPTAGELGYELEHAWHLGLMACGTEIARTLRALKLKVDRELLCLRCGELTAAWLGGGKLAAEELAARIAASPTNGARFAIGEPAYGMDGWRLTYRQAHEAFDVGTCASQSITKYAECSLLASALHNPMLASILDERYVRPLAGRSDMDARLRKTLRAYIEAECNATSAASALGVGRHTVVTRIRLSERLLGRPLRTCLAELDLALRLDELRAARHAGTAGLPATADRDRQS